MRINPFKLFNGSFVPEWLMTTGIVSSNAKIIYARLCRYAGEKGRCYPKLDELAEEVGLPLNTMRRALDELIEQGMVETVRRGLGLPNDYYFLWHELMGNPDCQPVGNQEIPPLGKPECPPVGTPISRESGKRVRQDNISLTTAGGGSDRFSEFWDAWPKHQRKAAKAQCEGIWRKEKLDAVADDILPALERFKASYDWQKAGGQYIPAPLVWLRQQRWQAADALKAPSVNDEKLPF